MAEIYEKDTFISSQKMGGLVAKRRGRPGPLSNLFNQTEKKAIFVQL
jgi:hypothetical protein